MGNDYTDANLTVCDREPITRLDEIQNFAFLIAMSNDWTIVRASENCEKFFKVKPQELLGTRFDRWISEIALHDIRNRMAILASTTGERIFDLKLVQGLPNVDLSIHFQGDLLIIEGERTQKAERVEAASMVRAMAARLLKSPTIAKFHHDTARQVLAITGFDRVMIYQFDTEGHGEVIAESARAGMESFLGLHYPASDIPRQARELYLRNPFRIIADVTAPTVPLLPPADAVTPPLDLSMSITRAVSPVHIEYLRNMGIGASLSISIVVEEKLWGLIACHANGPRLPSFIMRTASELFGAMYSMMLESRLRRGSEEHEQRARALADRVITMIAGDETLMENAQWLQDMTRDMVDCDGVAIYRSGKAHLHGSTPSEENVIALAHHLNAASPSRVFATDDLASVHAPCSATADRAAGMMSIPISRVPRDYILLFRRERISEIRWGGDPAKLLEASTDGERMSPRKSFAAFARLVRGRAPRFCDRDQRIGEAIRQALIEVILRYSDGASDERRRASERQEVLIAELNHRVRNILALIRSLVTKTSQAAVDVTSYVDSLSGRVQALARAHDRITRQSWGPAPLAGLFEDEIAAHDNARGRLSLKGPNVLLQAQAISTVALVVHELVTNSCKHGALSAAGRVEVTVEAVDGEGVYIKWKEIGGPAVVAPTRRGFGSVIVERTIPFDLQGTAELRFLLAGLEADFFIPRHYVFIADEDETPAPTTFNTDATKKTDVTPARLLQGTHVLLVEDNMLIALEAEDMLHELGAVHVALASTITEAEQLLAKHSFQFAMLDINVGRGTSFDLATKLGEAGTPFIFATGYGDELAIAGRKGNEVIIQKPYERDHLARAVQQVLTKPVA
ncbi:GAF domain-containing protein [Agrobacterium vitis]|uniref:HWE histidine kinase domain-containing protein n=1 Tax=Rhizobium/Agrobacterium group TaxID=227290 RepID=UPI0012E7BBCA|nr:MULTISPECIES: HWE histidine kinase domain-containing protein [Rhizobium/Agrobacterium group]MCF1475327.1 GAF domain-containing protein [Allorhizobium ampelinum]MCF1485674.1 GAF domain-containing protein [Allorhizobium ampelinum]MVA73457.1 GAF domain-containing protein [Agrobacterium vitis]NSZ19574.1 GAF domain-containing protein [Agrobacterium vitis]QZO07309.1 GAF domain-containing protein [Agrobacterium vitis]